MPHNLRYGFLFLLIAVIAVSSCANDGATRSPSTPAGPTPPTESYVVNGDGTSNVEKAHASLLAEGNQVYLIILNKRSTGLEGVIYQDLLKREYRATTGPDEGFDTHSEFCYPDCLFVPDEDVNSIGVENWIDVLRHEYRHIRQAKNNPQMAQDFRAPDGTFTTYAAFSEACADYGLNVAPSYHAQERIDQLNRIIGNNVQSLLDRACGGDKGSYQQIMNLYNQRAGQDRAFDQLFPTFK